MKISANIVIVLTLSSSNALPASLRGQQPRALQNSTFDDDIFRYNFGACRLQADGHGVGTEGDHYYSYQGHDVYSYQWCHDECERRSDCKAFEWTENWHLCEIWTTLPLGYSDTGYHSKCFAKYSSLEAPVESPIVWPYLDGYCRKDSAGHDSGDSGTDYELYDEDYSWCYNECAKRDSCKAFEWTDNNRCEIWKLKPLGHEKSNKGTKCYTKPVCTFTKRNGACRVNPDGSNYGDEGTHYNIYDAATLDDCREDCDAKTNCKGYEWSSHRCEIWLSVPFGFEPKEGYECHVKTCS